MTVTDSALLRVLQCKEPEIVLKYRNLIVPVDTDFSNISTIHKKYEIRYGSIELDAMKKLVFIACLLKIFNPASLFAPNILKSGIRAKIAPIINVSSERAVSYWMQQVRDYYALVKAFKSDVDSISLELMEE